jgi:hypothetical protein
MRLRSVLGLWLWLAVVASASAAESLPHDAFGRATLHLAVSALETMTESAT